MKKRLIITSALMTCLLGASLATGTYAWYQAADGKAKYSNATANTISTVENSYTTGEFTITAVLGTVDTKVDLTDTTGHTYYYLPDGKTRVDAGTSSNATGESTVNITITFTGNSALSDAEVAALWTSVGVKAVTVKLAAAGQVKVGLTANAAKAADAANEISFEFPTEGISFSSKEYTGTAQAWHYGVEGRDVVETQITNGSVTATPAKKAA